ncbi:Phage lysozyme [compost metagenome]
MLNKLLTFIDGIIQMILGTATGQKDSGVIVNANVRAMLATIRTTEGTQKASNPYSVVFGYGHTITNFKDHPSVTGEWTGKVLSDSMCRGAGLGPGCKSTAAGAYQFIKGTWNACKAALGLPDFSKASQDKAAVYLIKQRGAYADIEAGRISAALRKLSPEWASLPYSTYGQPTAKLSSVLSTFKSFGGTVVS